MKTTFTAFVLLIQTLQCLASDDSPFQLTNQATGFCLVKTNNNCNDIRWTTGDRLLVQQRNKCLGAQGKSVGSDISLYDCDENSELQKWECKNETVLALKGQELYIELTADNTAVLSKTTGPNNHLTISGTSNGACTRTYRELFAIGGNAAGMPCMFPFQFRDQWYSDCTTTESSEKRLWCAVETKFQSERWGYCPITSKEDWNIHPTTGAYYQLNTESALTWSQAETSCKQQGASLLSITDPHQQAYVTALLGSGGNKLWSGLVLDPEHGWVWSDRSPYRYLKWDSGHPLRAPGHNCAILDPAVQYSWQSTPCSKKLGYICHSKAVQQLPTQVSAVETGFCSRPWIPYNGHCFHLNRTQKTWSDAQRQCRDERGDLVSIRNVEDQSFVISQLGYASTDELWIGLNDRKTERLFDWSDHSPVSFTSWEFGKPTASTEIKDCVLIKGENGNWADHVCEEKYGFICMKMSASKPTGDEVEQDEGCKTGWRRHGSYCYFIGTQAKSFDEAKDDCKTSDSYLADVSKGVDNAFLVSLVGMRSEKYFWLGLSNQRNIDQFVWTNTDSVRFTHWNDEMPGHRQGCVAMKTGIFAGLWDVLPCTNKEKYICKHLAEGAVLTPAPPTLVPPRCTDGWTRIPLRNYCFKYFSPSQKLTWFEARDYCRAIGGDLLSIHSDTELQVIPDRYKTVWIGLSAPDPVTGYVWSDGSPVQFQHWEDGEPNNKNNVESCTEFKMNRRDSSGSWNDVHCEAYRGYLCQIRAGVTPKQPPDSVTPDYNETSDGWLEWKGNQYYFYKSSVAMEEGRRFCQQRHGDLVTINSEAESVFLWKQISKNSGSYWIGLTVDLDSTYGWMDGSPVVFQRWDENQPNFLNNDEHCAVMTSSMGFWHDYSCGREYKAICKRSGSPAVNATVAPTVPPRGGCPQNWEKFESKCYKIIYNQNETWEGARTQCKTMGGNLASIPSRKVQVFLTTQMAKVPTTDLWIGLHNVDHNSFYWTDGQPMRYSNWGSSSNRHSSYMDYEPDDTPGSDSHKTECAVIINDKKDTGKWIKKSCKYATAYVCLTRLDPSLPDSPETTTMDYVKLFNDSIKFVNQNMTWDAAKKNCEADGANLASLRNEWSKAYVELMAMKAPLWIGMNTKQTAGYFQYVDGWHVPFTNWAYSEPETDQPCVFVDTSGKWKTARCDKNMASVCMKSTDVPPTDSSVFPGFCPDSPDTSRYTSQASNWIPFRGHCYLFRTRRTEWPDASVECIRYGGTLVSIEDPAEQEFIARSIKVFEDSHSSFWLGLYKTQRGSWLWLDKSAMGYTNWGYRYNDGNSYGAIETEDGRWEAKSRWNDRAYICKTPKMLVQVPTTTVSSPMAPQTHGHTALAIVLVMTATVIGIAIILFLYKRSGRRLPIPKKLTTFDNPLFFNNEQPRPDRVDTNKLVATAD